MEALRECAKRAIEQFLDEWAAISVWLPDTPERRDLNKRAMALEEALLAMDDLRA